MKRRIILIILCIMGLISVGSFFSLLRYFDPYSHIPLAIGLLIVSFFIAVTSLLAVIIYFFKKIYYRGEVGIYHILTSLRQSFFVALFCVSVVLLLSMNIPPIVPLILGMAILIFLELFIRNW